MVQFYTTFLKIVTKRRYVSLENLLVSAMRSAGTYAGYHIMLFDLEATTWVTGEFEGSSDPT